MGNQNGRKLYALPSEHLAARLKDSALPAQPLRVLHTIGAAHAGGAEQFFLRFMTAFQDNPALEVLPVVRSGSWLAQQLACLNIPYETAPFRRRFDWTTKRHIAALAQSWQADVVQAWMNRAAMHLPQTSVPTVARMGGYYDLKYYRHAQHIIGNTEDLCQYIKKQGFLSENVHYLPNFTLLPPADFQHARDRVRQQLAIPETACVLLIPGRLHPVKGIDIALQALATLPQHVHLVLLGDGPAQQDLMALATQLGVDKQTHFLGWQPRIHDYAAAADVWLVPSRQETLGNTVLDAWAHGVAVIASAVSGPQSLITHDATGLLVPVEDVEALSAAIRTLVGQAEHRTTLAQAGHATFVQKFAPDIVKEKFIQFYQTISQKEAQHVA